MILTGTREPWKKTTPGFCRDGPVLRYQETGRTRPPVIRRTGRTCKLHRSKLQTTGDGCCLITPMRQELLVDDMKEITGNL